MPHTSLRHPVAPVASPAAVQAALVFDPADTLDRLPDGLRPWLATGVALRLPRLLRMKPHGPGDTRLLVGIASDDRPDQESMVYLRPVDAAKGRRLARSLCDQFADWAANPAAAVITRPAGYIESLGMLAQVFPADPRLPGLAAAIDPERIGPALRHTLALAESTTIGIDVLQYKPGRKCLVRYVLQTADRQSDVVYGHVCDDPAAMARTLGVVDADWDNPVFDVPAFLGMTQEPAIVLAGHLPGRQLSMTTDQPAFADHCECIGHGLAAMHARPMVINSTRRQTIDIDRVDEWAPALQAALPAGTADIASSLSRIRTAIAAAEHLPATLVHGDFHVANILVAGEQVGLLDFEHTHLGDPATDVGSFYAQLKLLALKVFNERSALDTAVGRFMDGYLRHASTDVSATIAAHCALSCLWAAYFQCIQRPSRAGSVERACQMAELGCDIAHRGLRQ